MQEKEVQKVVFVSLSVHTNLEHDEHTQIKKKKKPDQPITDLMKHLQKIIKL